MTHLNDTELEALAAEAERRYHWTKDDHHVKAAATLRARKGRGVGVKPLEWRNGHAHGVGHHYFTRNGCLYRAEFSGETGLHCGPSWEIEKVAQADYERRILSALDTSEERRGWNAAIEAAFGLAEPVHAQLARNIRALQKDHPHD